MIYAVVFAVWALYASLFPTVVSGLTHSQTSSLRGGGNPAMTPTYDTVTLPIPTVGVDTRLPTNEEKALTVVDDNSNQEIEELKEIEELLQHPVPEAEIEQEREMLQTSGDLPTKAPILSPVEGNSSAATYNEGVCETAKLFDSATTTVESDGAEDAGPNEESQKLLGQLQDSMAAMNDLPSVNGESFIKSTP